MVKIKKKTKVKTEILCGSGISLPFFKKNEWKKSCFDGEKNEKNAILKQNNICVMPCDLGNIQYKPILKKLMLGPILASTWWPSCRFSSVNFE